jgi:hypothetical protein
MTWLIALGVFGVAYLVRLGVEVHRTLTAVISWEDERRESHE